MGSQAKAKEVRAAKKQAARARKQRAAERGEQRKGAAFQLSGKPCILCMPLTYAHLCNHFLMITAPSG